MRQYAQRGRPPASSRVAVAEAAVELFFEHGYAGATIAMIAEKAGISKTSFFRYFSSKAEIVWSDFDAHTERLRTMLDAGKGGGLVSVRHAVVETLRRDLDSGGVSLRRFELLDTSPDLRSEESVRWFTWAEVVTDHLRDAAGQDHASVAHVAIGAATQATMLAVLRNGVRGHASSEQILTQLDFELERVCVALEPLLSAADW